MSTVNRCTEAWLKNVIGGDAVATVGTVVGSVDWLKISRMICRRGKERPPSTKAADFFIVSLSLYQTRTSPLVVFLKTTHRPGSISPSLGSDAPASCQVVLIYAYFAH